MATVVTEKPQEDSSGELSEGTGGHTNKLPDLNPIQEEDESVSRPTSAAVPQDLQLPPISAHQHQVVSTESLMEKLGLGEGEERSLGVLLKNVRAEVRSALEELTSITTHDDNLERQYRETVAENQQLSAALEKARGEMRHLKGQLSILSMTPAEIRTERARTQQRERRRQELEREAHRAAKSQLMERGASVQVLSAAERARTVNARGDYIDYQGGARHSRRSTHPAQGSKVKALSKSLPTKPKAEPLPPPLFGCTCSECNTQQSLGAVTLNRNVSQAVSQITKSGQQVLLGDRVVLRGERLGTVCYIGRLEFDGSDQVYVGIHLDLPLGNIDGYLKGRRYFHCPPGHGVMVRAADIVCVTGRKPLSGGTAVPRVRERLPTGLELSKAPDKVTSSVREEETTPSPTSVTPSSLVSDDAESMSLRIQKLALKSSRKAKELQKIQEDLRMRAPPTPPPTKITLDESVNLGISPQRPLTPGAVPLVSEATPTPRAVTPLENTLLSMLSERDLGATGFVTANELLSVLTDVTAARGLPQMSWAQVSALLAEVGVASEEGVGIPYHQLVLHLSQFLEA